MAKGNPKGGKKIQPGQVLNPTGRPKLTTSAREFKKLSLQEFLDNVQLYGSMPVDDLLTLVRRDDDEPIEIPALSFMAAQWVVDCISGKAETRNTAREALMNRLWGKVTDKIDHSGTPPPQVVITLPKKE